MAVNRPAGPGLCGIVLGEHNALNACAALAMALKTRDPRLAIAALEALPQQEETGQRGVSVYPVQTRE